MKAKAAKARGRDGDHHHHGTRHDWKPQKPRWYSTGAPARFSSECECGMSRYKSGGRLHYLWNRELRPEEYPLPRAAGGRRGQSSGQKKKGDKDRSLSLIQAKGYSPIVECPPCDRYELRAHRGL